MGLDTSFTDLDPYDVLGVKRSATPDEIRIVHRALVKSVHPDAGGGKERFQQVQWAFDLLMDPRKRDQFDRLGVVQGEEAATLDKVLIAINSLFDQVFNSEDQDESKLDVIGGMMAAVKAAKPRLQAEHRKAQKQLKRAKNIHRRLRKKATRSTPNLIANMLERRIQKAEAMVAIAADSVVVNEAMQKFLADYEYVTDAPGFGSGGLDRDVLATPGERGPGVYLGRTRTFGPFTDEG